jgi:hypothetical protein
MYLIKHFIDKCIKEYDFMRGNEPYKTRWNTTIRKNLEVRAIKRRIIPLVYDWLTKNDEFSPLTFWMGKHLSVK